MVLKRTNVLSLNGLDGEFKGFSYGGPLAEAALAEQIDVLFAADQPAINLIATGAKWKIVGKCVNFRDAILVPPNSRVQRVSDLRGRKVAVPFGSGAHRIVFQSLSEAGLDTTRDVKVINLDVPEISATVQAGVVDKANGLWKNEIAAVAGWDPYIADFERQHLAKPLVEKQLFGVTAMSERFIASAKTAPTDFLKALYEAVYYYARNQSVADTWYLQEVHMSLDPSTLSRAASFDPNLSANALKDIDLRLTEDDIRVLQQSSDFAFRFGLIKNHVTASDAVDNQFVQSATDNVRTSPPPSDSVRPLGM